MLTRRAFAGLGAATLAWGMGGRGRAAAPRRRVLILIKLAGGNDGLNMLAPYGDPAYRRARPSIGLEASEVLPLGDGLGLHFGLAPLEDAWAAGDLALVRGIGYRPPDRSHFRSMDVWETGGAPGAPRPEGWLSRILPDDSAADTSLGLLVIGSDPLVPVAGGALPAFELGVDMATPEPIGPATDVRPGPAANPALAHVLAVQRQLARARAGLSEALAALPDLATRFPPDEFGRRLQLAARIIAAGSPAPVILVPLGGFDTHAGQRAVHDALMTAVGAGLAALRSALIEAQCWSSATVATYSEFGRRLNENGAGGTDHGTAAPHIVIGGAVAGGWHGAQPSLTALEDRDPVPGLDFRSYLGGLATAGLGLDRARVAAALGGITPLVVGD